MRLWAAGQRISPTPYSLPEQPLELQEESRPPSGMRFGTGGCADAVTQRFFRSLKHEWTQLESFDDLEAARLSLFKTIETSARRGSSGLGHRRKSNERKPRTMSSAFEYSEGHWPASSSDTARSTESSASLRDLRALCGTAVLHLDSHRVHRGHGGYGEYRWKMS